MSDAQNPSGCACCSMNRRGFLAGCATCAGALLFPRGEGLAAPSAEKKKHIRVVYALHAEVQARPDWPNVGFDFRPVMERMTGALSAGCPEMEFIPTMAAGPDQAQAVLEQDKSGKIDGYVVVQMNCWNAVVETLLTSGKPVLFADFLYGGSGGFLLQSSKFLQHGTKNFGFIGSSRFSDVVDAAQCFMDIANPNEFAAAVAKVRKTCTKPPGDQKCRPDALQLASPSEWKDKMKDSKILAVGDKRWRGPDEVIEQLGVQLADVTFAEVNDAWKTADKEECQRVADRWENRARKIFDVDRKELENSAAMYLAMKEVVKRHRADGIAINCLGGFYGNHIHAYPCLGFHELCNEGIVGACECDLVSATTMLALKNLTGGRTGFISDPVIDFAKRQIVYAHCVAHNRAFGPEGEENPVEILTHSEDRRGAAVRSLLPAGYMTSTVELGAYKRFFRKEILFHRGKAVENIIVDRACRTKLAVEPDGDIERLMTQWDAYGWHRVTVYGDLKEPLSEIAKMLGWKFTEEA